MKSTDSVFPNIGIRQVVAIHSVANLRNIKMAAEQMYTTQSTLSRLIASAERTFGIPLFRRGWSGTETTPEGESVVRTCQYILNAITAAQTQLFDSHSRQPPLNRVLRMRHLEAINAVTRTGGVSTAAQELGRSQPDISRSISTLAQRLGIDCFRRTSSGMVPLAAAEVLSKLYSTIVHHLKQLRQLLLDQEGEIMGRVAIGMLPFSGQEIIPKVFASLTKTHPNIKLVCVTGSYYGLVEALRRHEIDRIIGILRNDEIASDLVESFLYPERFSIVARHDHPMQSQAKTMADLKQTNWVVAPHGTPVRTHFESLFQSVDAVPPIQTCEMLSFASAEQMLVESDSVGLLSYGDKQLQNLRPELKVLKIKLPKALADIGLTRLASDTHNPAIKEFERIIHKVT